MKILVQGYYGFGNLGDDLLMTIIFNYLKSLFPKADFSIFSNAEPETNRYIKTLLLDDVDVINYSYRGHFDVIIHGGGGVHYDFKKGPSIYRFINVIIRILGFRNYNRIYSIYKRLKNKEFITATRRIGIGIGVGTFTPSSSNFFSNITILSDYDLLFVRDKTSLHEAGKYLKKDKINLAGDLAFCKDYWGLSVPKKAKSEGKRIGVVLRNWDFETDHYISIMEACEFLQTKGCEVKYFLFEKEYDSPLIDRYKGNLEFRTWTPIEEDLVSFLDEFRMNDLIVTSRFHGSIIAASFGIPSIAIAIEPKLITLQEMLPSVTVVNLPISKDELGELILDLFQKLDDLNQNVSKEYLTKQKEMKESLDLLAKFLV